MRRTALTFVVLLAACDVTPHNLFVVSPPQLEGAAIVVDGGQQSSLASGDARAPVRRMLAAMIGHPAPIASGICQVPAGTHTVRVVKAGWEPVERAVHVENGAVAYVVICRADVRPLK